MKNIVLLKRETIDDIYDIYKPIRLLYVKDRYGLQSKLIEDVLSHIKDELFSYEILEANDARETCEEIIRKKQEGFNMFIGDGIGGLLLFASRVNPTFAIYPVLNPERYVMEHFDEEKRKEVLSELKSLIDPSFLDKRTNRYSLDRLFFGVEKLLLSDDEKEYVSLKEFQKSRSKKSINLIKAEYSSSYPFASKSKDRRREITEELINFIKSQSLAKDEEKDGGVCRSSTWKKNWLKVVLYDHQWDFHSIYTILLHKLSLMLDYLSDKKQFLATKRTQNTICRTLSNAIQMLKACNDLDYLDYINIINGEIGEQETHVVYDRKFDFPIYYAYKCKGGFADSLLRGIITSETIEKELSKYRNDKRYVVEDYIPGQIKDICYSIYDNESKGSMPIDCYFGNGKRLMRSLKHPGVFDMKKARKYMKTYEDKSRYRIETLEDSEIFYDASLVGKLAVKREEALRKKAFGYIAKYIAYWWN